VGRELILEYLVSLEYTPPQTHGCGEITRSLGCSYPEEQQQHWSCTTRIFPSVLVLPTEEWQQDNVQSSVLTGDEGRLGNLCICLHLQGTTKTITLFTKIKAYLKTVLRTIHRLLYKIYSVHMHLRYSRTRSPRGVQMSQTYLCKNLGVEFKRRSAYHSKGGY